MALARKPHLCIKWVIWNDLLRDDASGVGFQETEITSLQVQYQIILFSEHFFINRSVNRE